MRWYEGKSCAVCGKTFGRIGWFGNQPALMAPDGKTLETNDLSEEEIVRLLTDHRPVCWKCHLSKAFQRVYPKGA